MAIGTDFAILTQLGDLLIKTSSECVPLEKQPRFEREVVEDISQLVEKLGKAAKSNCNGSWQGVSLDWQHLEARTEEFEKATRTRELANPATEEDFRANLFWMHARGTEDDLELLMRLKNNPPYHSEDLLTLLDWAVQRIRERANQDEYSSEAFQKQGEEAYQLNKDKWQQQYAGQYIAIYQGEVFASDTDKAKLNEKIFKRQREIGAFRSYVIHVQNPIDEKDTMANSGLIAEEISDLKSYLDGLPSALRDSGAFIAYESRLERLQQRLERLKPTQDAEGAASDSEPHKRD